MSKKMNKKLQNKLGSNISSVNDLKAAFDRYNIKKSDKFYDKISKVVNSYPALISPHLFKQCLKSEAIYKQFIPDGKELNNFFGKKDPLDEESRMATKKLVHMYPDRVLLLATDICFSSCRFCTRKRIKKAYEKITERELNDVYNYLIKNKQIKDVIISGGDPLTMSDFDLVTIIKKIKAIKNIKIIRIGTRAPISNPSRITDRLVKMLKRLSPIYINIHINHPDEFTDDTKVALRKLFDAGMILGSQTVLLKGINDDSRIIKELLYKCLENGIRPYYLYQCDEVSGTEHFWTDYQRMFEIAQDLIGNISGLAIPNFSFDCMGGGGKVRILPEFYKQKNRNSITFKTPRNVLYTYKNFKIKK